MASLHNVPQIPKYECASVISFSYPGQYFTHIPGPGEMHFRRIPYFGWRFTCAHFF